VSFPELLGVADRMLLNSLGVNTTYASTPTGPSSVVRGIFSAAYVRAEVGEAGVSSGGPAVFYRFGDLPSDPGDGDARQFRIVVAGVTYRGVEVEKDGQGGVVIRLHKV
jgi:hypothetical protein